MKFGWLKPQISALTRATSAISVNIAILQHRDFTRYKPWEVGCVYRFPILSPEYLENWNPFWRVSCHSYRALFFEEKRPSHQKNTKSSKRQYLSQESALSNSSIFYWFLSRKHSIMLQKEEKSKTPIPWVSLAPTMHESSHGYRDCNLCVFCRRTLCDARSDPESGRCKRDTI